MAARRKRKAFQRPEEFEGALALLQGQPDLKRKLVSVFSQYTHFLEDESVGRPLVLVYGPSSTGKTVSIEWLCKASGLPFTIISGSTLSPAGHRGLSAREMLGSHYAKWKTDEGVIFVDEVDKWCAGAIGKDPERTAWNLGLQHQLLHLLEGEDVELVDEADWDEEKGETAPRFNTARTMWIVAGAFVGLDNIVRRRSNSYLPKEETYQNALPSDFILYGLSTEFANRIQTWVWTKPLSKLEMMAILREQACPQWISRFKRLGIELVIEDGALGRCIDAAFIEGTGARGSFSFLRRAMDDVYVEASRFKPERVVIDGTTISTGHLELHIAQAG